MSHSMPIMINLIFFIPSTHFMFNEYTQSVAFRYLSLYITITNGAILANRFLHVHSWRHLHSLGAISEVKTLTLL